MWISTRSSADDRPIGASCGPCLQSQLPSRRSSSVHCAGRSAAHRRPIPYALTRHRAYEGGTVPWRCDAIPCPSPPAITPGNAPCHAHSGQRARVAGRPAHKARAGTNKQAGFTSQRTQAGTAQRARKLAVGSFTGARPASARDSLEVTGPAHGTDADRPEGGTDGVPAAGRRVRPPPQAASARIPSGPRPTSTSCGMDRRLPRSLGSRLARCRPANSGGVR